MFLEPEIPLRNLLWNSKLLWNSELYYGTQDTTMELKTLMERQSEVRYGPQNSVTEFTALLQNSDLLQNNFRTI